MTDAAVLRALADEIERAEPPYGVDARRLDARMWCAVCGYEFVMWDGGGVVYRDPKAGNNGVRRFPHNRLDAYSTSLDAALSLVPEGMGVALSIAPRGVYADAKVIEPVITLPGDGTRVTNWKMHASKLATMGVLRKRTAPIALCAAALRALAQMENDKP